MFMPMLHIYSKFNWVEAPEKEVIFLNDFQYNDGRIKWNLFLNFFNGAPTSVAMPKNYFAFDVDWTECQPLFAIAEKKIVNKSCQQEYRQRWDVTGGWKKDAYNSTVNLHMEKSIMTLCPAPVVLLGFYLKFKQTHYSIYAYLFLLFWISWTSSTLCWQFTPVNCYKNETSITLSNSLHL